MDIKSTVIYESNLVTRAVHTGHGFTDINNMRLKKQVPRNKTIMKIRENLHYVQLYNKNKLWLENYNSIKNMTSF